MKFIPIGIYGRFPSAKGACSSYLLQSENGDVNVVIDFGCGAGIELQKHIRLEKIDAVILSHLHYDHISDILPFAYFLEKIGKHMPLYLPSGSEKIINSDIFYKHENTSKININGLKIECIEVKHGKIKSRMIKIKGDNKTLLYTSDFSDIEEYKSNLCGVDIVVGDAFIFNKNDESPHISVKELAENTPSNTKLYLCHLNDSQEKVTLNEALKYHSDTQMACIGRAIII